MTAVIGASGYVGTRLVDRLLAEGHDVVAVARSPDRLPVGAGVRRVAADATDGRAIAGALVGVGTVYYLVHSMAAGPGFVERDRAAARILADAARTAGVDRIVYLGGLGGPQPDPSAPGPVSAHLASRHEVGEILRRASVPVVELRAAVVLGAGSISFEMLRYLTERLPAMVCPRWVDTRVQPIAERDLLDCLLAARTAPAGIYEIGSPDVTTYHDMMQAYATARGLRARRIVKVPVLTPSLSAHWVDAVTPVDRSVSHALIESLTNEVTVQNPGAPARLGVEPMPVGAAILAALDEQAERIGTGLFGLPEGLVDGVYVVHTSAPVPPGRADAVRRDLAAVGGDLRWYGPWRAWRLRLAAGRLFGERLHLGRPDRLHVGATVDWWTVLRCDRDALVLTSRAWTFGDAWLGFRLAGETPQDPGARAGGGVASDGPVGGRRGVELVQVAAFRPRGALGLAYWRALWPVHRVVFARMARHRAAGGA